MKERWSSMGETIKVVSCLKLLRYVTCDVRWRWRWKWRHKFSLNLCGNTPSEGFKHARIHAKNSMFFFYHVLIPWISNVKSSSDASLWSPPSPTRKVVLLWVKKHDMEKFHGKHASGCGLESKYLVDSKSRALMNVRSKQLNNSAILWSIKVSNSSLSSRKSVSFSSIQSRKKIEELKNEKIKF